GDHDRRVPGVLHDFESGLNSHVEYRGDFRPRLGGGGPRLEPRHQPEPFVATRRRPAWMMNESLCGKRYENVVRMADLRAKKLGRRNADDRVGNIFDRDLLSQDAGVESKAALPVRVAYDGDSGSAGPVVFGSNQLAD